jgi:ABC-type amino acid transport substrate-binding protein
MTGFRRFILLLLAAAVVGTGAIASAPAAPLDEVVAKGILRIAVYRDFPPFSWRERGELKGADVDLARAIASGLGVSLDLMELTADENMDDDLRNAVWKGHYLGGGIADVMLHVPVNRDFALRNDHVAIFGPYQRESFAISRNPSRINDTAGLAVFQSEKIGVELDSIPDFYLMGTFGGRLGANVVHYTTVEQAVDALRSGAVAAVMAPRSQLEGALGQDVGRFPIGTMPTPGLINAQWNIGLAVKENSRDLAYKVEDIVTGLLAQGTLKEIYDRYGLTHTEPSEQ